jgi:hypothetical protein
VVDSKKITAPANHRRDLLALGPRLVFDGALTGRGRFDAIHLLGHGCEGSQSLGDTQSSRCSLKRERATLGDSLTDQGDLLLYGCYVAAFEAGRDVGTELARLTRAGVAASTDTTGASGTRVLEQATRPIDGQWRQVRAYHLGRYHRGHADSRCRTPTTRERPGAPPGARCSLLPSSAQFGMGRASLIPRAFT